MKAVSRIEHMIPLTNDFSIESRKLGGLPASLPIQAGNSFTTQTHVVSQQQGRYKIKEVEMKWSFPRSIEKGGLDE